jgi:DNA transposition AAA+ family ATPase
MANLMTATIAKSMQEIRLLLPNWLSTSNMAYIIKTTVNSSLSGEWCNEFMEIGYGDTDQANAYCAPDSGNPTNFTDVE